MDIKLSHQDQLENTFDITIPASLIAERIDAHLAEAAKTTTVAGFRPGKVPLTVMKQKYGDVALEKTMDKLLQEAVKKALADHKINPAMQPKIDAGSYEDGKDFKFKMTVESLPEINDVDVKKLKVQRLDVQVGDEKVTEVLDLACSEMGTKEPLKTQRAAKKGDFVKIDFDGFVDGKALDNGKATDFELELGSKSLIDGFEEGLIGVKPGEKVTLNLAFPEGYHEESLSGKPVVFEVTLKSILEKKPAELNDTLAKKYGYDSVQAMKDGFKARLKEDYQRFARDVEKHDLLEQLDKLMTIQLPKQMVEAEFDVICTELQNQKASAEKMTKEEKEKLRAEYYPKAERRVKLGLILSNTARKRNIVVSPQELEQAVMEKARSYAGQEQIVINYYNKNPEAVNMLRAPIIEEKVIDSLLAEFEDKPKAVTIDELKKMVDQRQSA
ncbi:MAG: trigger factor [Rickettsiales bacterium]|nr:trigger factor [Rickettsiales bacterium]|tara:strand:- start:6592 stop:7917 length:1326 start_codon:yes stop_codon:yes gene_type:complete